MWLPETATQKLIDVTSSQPGSVSDGLSGFLLDSLPFPVSVRTDMCCLFGLKGQFTQNDYVTHLLLIDGGSGDTHSQKNFHPEPHQWKHMVDMDPNMNITCLRTAQRTRQSGLTRNSNADASLLAKISTAASSSGETSPSSS